MPRPNNPHQYRKIWQEVAMEVQMETPPMRVIVPGRFEELRLEWYSFRAAHEKQALKVRKWGDEEGFHRHMKLKGLLDLYRALKHEQGLMLEHMEAEPDGQLIVSKEKVSPVAYEPPRREHKKEEKIGGKLMAAIKGGGKPKTSLDDMAPDVRDAYRTSDEEAAAAGKIDPEELARLEAEEAEGRKRNEERIQKARDKLALDKLLSQAGLGTEKEKGGEK